MKHTAKEKYFIVSAHREEIIISDRHFFALFNTLNPISTERITRTTSNYFMPNVCNVAQIILTHTNYINRVVWQKH